MVNVGDYLRSFYIDTENDNIIAYDVCNALSTFKRMTGAKVINIGDITVEDKAFKIVYTHSSSSDVHISVVNTEGKTIFRGSVIVMGFDTINGRDVLRDLTDDEVDVIKRNLGLMVITGKEGKEPYNAYVLCNVVYSKD